MITHLNGKSFWGSLGRGDEPRRAPRQPATRPARKRPRFKQTFRGLALGTRQPLSTWRNSNAGISNPRAERLRD